MTDKQGFRYTLPQQTKIENTPAILVYGHVHILWTYQGAKIGFWMIFSLIVSLKLFFVPLKHHNYIIAQVTGY